MIHYNIYIVIRKRNSNVINRGKMLIIGIVSKMLIYYIYVACNNNFIIILIKILLITIQIYRNVFEINRF